MRYIPNLPKKFQESIVKYFPYILIFSFILFLLEAVGMIHTPFILLTSFSTMFIGVFILLLDGIYLIPFKPLQMFIVRLFLPENAAIIGMTIFAAIVTAVIAFFLFRRSKMGLYLIGASILMSFGMGVYSLYHNFQDYMKYPQMLIDAIIASVVYVALIYLMLQIRKY